MEIAVELYKMQKVPHYTEELLANIAIETIKIAGFAKDNTRITISVAIVNEDEMQRANYFLRKKNVITDVLSIGEYSDDKKFSKEKESNIFLGEVILCYNYIEQSAREKKQDVDKEFFTAYAHGILHLLGFAHSKKMFKLQDAVSAKFCCNKENNEKSSNQS